MALLTPKVAPNTSSAVAAPAVAAPVAAAVVAKADENNLKHKRRFCRHDGCKRIVKSQGLCQRHGAKPRTCKVEGCDKQAQGNFDKMCKSHFKAMKRRTTPLPRITHQGKAPPTPVGVSVYDGILPASISYTTPPTAPLGDSADIAGVTAGTSTPTVMPLVAHLKEGFVSNKPPAWHRNEERSARGILPVENPATQLEGWERELVWMEILVLTGALGVSFRHLARAWGRDKGFHTVLAQFICERQGDVQRKKRLLEKEERTPDAADAMEGKSRGPAKKRRRLKKNANLAHDVSANIWDDSAYGDHVTNEALAADIFDFSPKEFESSAALQRWKQTEQDDHSDTTSMNSDRSRSAPAAPVAGRGKKIMSKSGPANRTLSPKEHPEHNPETSALRLTSDDNNPTPIKHSLYVVVAPSPAAAAPAGPNLVPQQPLYQRNHPQQYDATAQQQQQGQFQQQPAPQQNRPQYAAGSCHQQTQPPQNDQNQPHGTNADCQQGQFHQSAASQHTLPHYDGGGGHQQKQVEHQGNLGHQPHYDQNQPYNNAIAHQQQQQHQQHGRYLHPAASQAHVQVQYQAETYQHVQQPQPYVQNQQPLMSHGMPSVGHQYAESTPQVLQYVPPLNVQNQEAPYLPAHPQQAGHQQQYQQQLEQQQQQQQHGQYVAHQQNEHPEQDPETSALPPELAHPQGGQQQFPLQQN